MIEINRVLMKGDKFGQDALREAHFDSDKHLKELLNFGYEILDEDCYKRVNGVWRKYTTLGRVSTIPNHNELVKLENEYEKLRKSKKDMPRVNGFVAFLLFLIIIFPGIIYLSVKNKKKKQTIKENEETEKRIQETLEKARKLAGKR